MGLDASNYISNRKSSKTALIDSRIKEIQNYIIDCYLLFKNDGVTYTKGEKGKISQEDYFRNGLVDGYLRRNKHLLNLSSTTDIRFNRESTETYVDTKGIKHDDKIDVHVTDVALQNYWTSDDEIYYAIECKRIKILSDTEHYVGDIEKFTNRKYLSTRLPFEGQIAFIENSKLINTAIVKETNSKLKKHTSIVTKKLITEFKTHTSFEGSYLSKHVRNQTKEVFVVNHLLFDYTNVLLN